MHVRRGSDRLVLFTDAIIEAESESGEYGLDRLVEAVTDNPIEGDVLSQKVLESVHEFAAGRPMTDDLTLVIADL
jgi:serine phosphatase RsbU (regulator of sigma subunit)